MFKLYATSWRTQRVTTDYPARVESPPANFRGPPALQPDRCSGDGACVDACPSGAISLERANEPAGLAWRLDLARCVMCGRCAEVCPAQAITMTHEFELAAKTRSELLRTTWCHGEGVAATDRPSGVTSAVVAAETRLISDGQRLLARIMTVLTRSLHIRHMDAGSDNGVDWELSALLNPIYDIQRLGLDVVASPRHADALFVTGPVTRNLEQALRFTYEAMPAPAIVIAAGDEACGGGLWQGSYATAGGVDRVLPVDVYIPGSPPRPQAIIHGLLLAVDRVGRNNRPVAASR